MPPAVSKKPVAAKTESVVDAKSPKKAASKPAAPVVENPKTTTPVTAPAPAPAPAVLENSSPVVKDEQDVSSTVATECPVTSKLNEIETLINEVDTRIRDLKNKAKALRKDVAMLLKQKQKASKKSSNASRAPRAPSGFAKPALVSDEMYTFLNVEKGTLIARVDVTRKINEYIRANNLQNPTDKRQILPDAKLRELLKIGPDAHVTFFNVQSYLSPHFPKAAAA